jgi:hypothetical protein
VEGYLDYLQPRDFKQYIGSRNYSIVPMQKDVALDQPEAPNPDQEAWEALNPDQRFPYATILGKVVYLNAITRPDISCSVSTLSRLMAKPSHAACRGLARLLNYLTTQPSSDFDTMAPS